MKQTIQLRLGQHLTMTPQLQQAIRLLQLSTTELQLEVQQALDSNLMLEPADDETEQDIADLADLSATSTFDNAPASDTLSSSNTETERDSDDRDGESLEVDSAWDDIYDSAAPHTQNSDQAAGEYENQGNADESLSDHLLWQMRLTPFSDTDRVIAMAIIDSVMDDGYLSDTLENILTGIQGELKEDAEGVPEHDIRIEEVEAVLHCIQNFGPPGVAARNLSECLLLQLQQLSPDTPWLAEAKRLVKDHLDLLANHDYSQLMRQMKIPESALGGVVELIQTLNPRPGGQITASRPQYVIPDVYVKKHEGMWRVELNPAAAPRVRINTQYASLIRRADNSNDNNYLKNHLQEARWFIKSLRSRNETLLKVATCIVERQRNFLEHGEEAMRAMVLHDVAEAVNMHESTISRVTTQKYMHTPRGIFELKYFFSSHVNTTIGGECSATAIRALIKKLVSNEGTSKPLSDSKIADILLKQGINVARRTVAKYRESLAIPPSNERKRLS
ncbi:MAG: RNA polymerase factor sigma-54 [Gammaproteobacteria bacterium]